MKIAYQTAVQLNHSNGTALTISPSANTETQAVIVATKFASDLLEASSFVAQDGQPTLQDGVRTASELINSWAFGTLTNEDPLTCSKRQKASVQGAASLVASYAADESIRAWTQRSTFFPTCRALAGLMTSDGDFKTSLKPLSRRHPEQGYTTSVNFSRVGQSLAMELENEALQEQVAKSVAQAAYKFMCRGSSLGVRRARADNADGYGHQHLPTEISAYWKKPLKEALTNIQWLPAEQPIQVEWDDDQPEEC